MTKYIFLFFAASMFVMTGCVNQSQDKNQKEEQNKNLIISYYNEPSELKRLHFMAESYKQHNPLIEDGKEGLRSFFSKNHSKFPNIKQRVIRIAADGDFVWVHLHTVRNPGDRGLAVINIFRIDGGKIAEHWDVVQPVPEKSANSNSMF